MLKVKELVETLEDFKAVDHVPFTIPDGRILGLTSQNGAGKTAIFHLALNFLTQDSGSVLWNGQPLDEKECNIIGYLPEERGLYPKIMIGDQPTYFASLRGRTKKEIKLKIGFWMEKFQVESKKTGKVKSSSEGNQQEVQLVTTFIYEPELIVLGEPFSGSSPVDTGLLKDDIIELKNQSFCVVPPSHNMDNVEKICNYLVTLKNGHMVLDGQIHEVRQQFGRTGLFLESPLSTEGVAATTGVEEAHLRQDDASEATLKNAEVGKMLFDKTTASGCIPMFNQQPPTLGEISEMKISR